MSAKAMYGLASKGTRVLMSVMAAVGLALVQAGAAGVDMGRNVFQSEK